MLNKKGVTPINTLVLVVMTLILIGFSLFIFLTERPKVEEEFKDVALLDDLYKKDIAIKFYFNYVSDLAAYEAYNELSVKRLEYSGLFPSPSYYSEGAQDPAYQKALEEYNKAKKKWEEEQVGKPREKVFDNEANFIKFKNSFDSYFKKTLGNLNYLEALYYFEHRAGNIGNSELQASTAGGFTDEKGEEVKVENYLERIKSSIEANEYSLDIENGVLLFQLNNFVLEDLSFTKEGGIEESRFKYEPKIEYRLDLKKFEADMES